MALRISDELKRNYEYTSGDALTGLASKYIIIPSSLTLNTNMNDKRAIVFAYFMVNKNLDDTIYFSVPDLIAWCGFKPDNRKTGISQKFVDVIDSLKNEGYLEYDNIPMTTALRIKINMEAIVEKNKGESFAVIYLDELEAIKRYEKKLTDKKDAYINPAAIFLIFSFLRHVIYKRSNKMRPEEINVDGTNNRINDIKHRREIFPEAYCDSYKNIGKILKISERAASKILDILEEDLKLIVKEIPYRTINESGKFYTQPAIFANTYKREGEYLLASGEDYSKNEIQNKVNLIKQYNDKYIINKSKRKSTKGDCQ